MESFAKNFWIMFYKIIISIVAGIYQLVGYVYQIFLLLVNSTDIFTEDQFNEIVNKVYIILGVVMLFVIAYNILTYIIDPEKNKGGQDARKVLVNIVTSLIMIVIAPAGFSLAFRFQKVIINYDIVGQMFNGIVYGSGNQTYNDSIKDGGYLMAVDTFVAFFVPSNSNSTSYDIAAASTMNQNDLNYSGCSSYSLNCNSVGSCSLQQAKEAALKCHTFKPFKAFAYNCHEGGDFDQIHYIDFSFIIGLIAGGYLLYVIVSFCFDITVRLVKLVFYQIMAPICISFRIIPKKDDIFKNWWKATLKTYLSVFIRVFIMGLSVFLISLAGNSDWLSTSCSSGSCSVGVTTLARAFIILGIITFMKQAAKLIDELFSLGDVKLGIADKLKEGGAFTGLGAARSFARGSREGFFSRTQGWKNMNRKDRAKALAKGAASSIGGGFSAARRSLSANTNSFGFKALKDQLDSSKANAAQAVLGANEARFDRDAKINTLHKLWDERKDHRINKARLSELKKLQEDYQKEYNKAYEEFLKTQKEYDKYEASLVDSTRAISELQYRRNDINSKMSRTGISIDEYDKLKKIRDELDREITDANNRRATLTVQINNAKTARDNAKDILDIKQNALDAVKKEYETTYSIEMQFDAGRIKDEFKTKVIQFATGIDTFKAETTIEKYNDAIKNSTDKVIEKFKDKIKVSVGSSFKKNDFLNSFSSYLDGLFTNYSYAQLDGLASSMAFVSDRADLAKKLGISIADLSRVGVNSEADVEKFKSAFIDTIRGAYKKNVSSSVQDALVDYDKAKKVFAGNEYMILHDLASSDAKLAIENYNAMLGEMLPQERTPVDADGRKTIADSIKAHNMNQKKKESIEKMRADRRSAAKSDKDKK